MKEILRITLALLLCSFIFNSCCGTKTVTYKGVTYNETTKTVEEIRNGVNVQSPKDLRNPGKIYIFGEYLFINESGEGVHIYNNSNPKNPQNLAFINIPGNGDMAVKGNYLFADSYLDMVIIDISSPANAIEAGRIKDLFPNSLDSRYVYYDKRAQNYKILTPKDTTYTYTYSDCDLYGPDIMLESDGNPREFSKDAGNPGASGRGGSTARFTIYRNYLYTVDRRELKAIDISYPPDPNVLSTIRVGWDVETIYPFRDKLFIGSMTGMYIYDNSVPTKPQYISMFSHARACDPVVADDDYAYVTVRTNNRCEGFLNQLDILDISDLFKPKLIKSYPMKSPAGLGIDEKVLFICDDDAGLKVFDVRDPSNMKILDWKLGMHTYDVIPWNKHLIMTGADGIYQFDYSDPKNLKTLSVIKKK